jgi:threonyl-tRNA synthetase
MILYRSIPHSYRDLPVRYTCTTTVYRHEKSGELSGLTRVRALTQDDCHVFAMPNQIEQEINLMLDMIAEVYKTFGFNDFWVRISTHDPKDKDKYIGDPKIWEDSETILTNLIQKRGWKHDIGVGEAAFYGPKLDFIFKDAIGRDWQLSTIQLDMNLPQRFELEYVDEKSEKQRPVVIHRAILGSTERFMGILIEHFAGAFPAWLAPVQVTVIPVSEKTLKYAEEVFAKLKQHNIRAEFSEPNESLGKRIREAEMMKVPYIIVVGEKEEREDMVNVRARNKNKESEEVEMKTEKFIEKIEREIRERTL